MKIYVKSLSLKTDLKNSDMPNADAVKSNLNNLKQLIVRASAIANEGHIPSAFSILDILWVLYDRILDVESIKSNNPHRDRFVLSKGHGSLALYAILANKGFFPESELLNFCKFNSNLGGHPDCNKVQGVEVSSGSLGHGFPMAVGIALSYFIQKINGKVFTLIGDGECNEGTIWESALLASHHHLNNLYCIIDYNHSTDRALKLGSIADKFASFGWSCEVINGHNHFDIYKALTLKHADKPIAVIAETIKGFGCSCMENEPAWHHRAPTQEELQNILEELS